ncbi:MAG: hypothetical protein ABJG14_15085, partial [Sulfitobacter sp.]|uniref:hypothetical protein n=1 Tax=Alphaproteobacteria TaxID=28211 RepID=UPI003267C608
KLGPQTNLSRRTTMAAKRPARASLRYAKAPLSPRYQRELHQLLGHCSSNSSRSIFLHVNGKQMTPNHMEGPDKLNTE